MFKAAFCTKLAWWQLLDHSLGQPLGAAWTAVVAGIWLWACLPRGYGGGLLLLGVLQLHAVGVSFPYTINHAFFELWVTAILLLLPDARALWLVRTLFLTVLFWAGVQKAGQGRYLDGELYAWFAVFPPDRPLGLWLRGQLDLAAAVFELEPLIPVRTPPDWLQRTAVDVPRGALALLAVLSWATVLAELVLPALLAVRRTRLLGVAGAVGLFLVIDASTRERSFVLTSLLCTALFLPGAAPSADGRLSLRALPRGVLALFALVAAWPPLHLLASRALGFSAWRLSGWGMYAALHESQREIRILPLTDPCGPLRASSFVPIPRKAPGVQRLQAFPSAQAAALLVSELPEPQDRFLVWLIEPRLDGWSGSAYGDVRGWIVEGGRARAVDGFSSGDGRAEAHLASACAAVRGR